MDSPLKVTNYDGFSQFFMRNKKNPPVEQADHKVLFLHFLFLQLVQILKLFDPDII